MRNSDQRPRSGVREMAMAAHGDYVVLLHHGRLVARYLDSHAERTLARDLGDDEHGLRVSLDGRRASLKNHRGQLRIWDTSTGDMERPWRARREASF